MMAEKRISPRAVGKNEASGPQDGVVVIWVCPNCGNYVGSTMMSGVNLNDQMAHDIFGKETHPRSQCPNCKSTRIKRFARLIPQDEVDEALKRVQREVAARPARPTPGPI